MSGEFDDRKEELLRKRDDEAIEKMREKIKIAAAAKAVRSGSMRCPRCDGTLVETEFEDVSIDTCDTCGGIWLDSGELEQLTRKEESGWISRLWFSEG